MLPVEDFDAPEALRERFELLRGGGAAPGPLPRRRADAASTSRIDDAGRAMRATLHVPATAPFFADHFPRRPVFPARCCSTRRCVSRSSSRAKRAALARPRALHADPHDARQDALVHRARRSGSSSAPSLRRRTTASRKRSLRRRPTARVGRDARGSSSQPLQRDSPMTHTTPRRDHRHRPRHAGRQRRRDDVGRARTARAAARRRSRVFDAAGFPTRIAAEVKDFDADAITADRASSSSYANRSHRFALAAAEQAMRDAGIEPTDGDRDALGLRGRHRHDGRRASTSSPRCSGIRRPTASSHPISC